MTAHDSEPQSAGWTLTQLAETIRNADALLLDAIVLLAPDAHGGMPDDAEIALSAHDAECVSDALEEAAELTERLRLLASRLPAGELHATYEEVRTAAAADLAQGIIDPRRALLAARLLDVEHGWPALAQALRESDVAPVWEGIGVAELLGCFRGADRAIVERAVADAQLAPETSLASCPPDRLEALAGALERHASRPHGP